MTSTLMAPKHQIVRIISYLDLIGVYALSFVHTGFGLIGLVDMSLSRALGFIRG